MKKYDNLILLNWMLVFAWLGVIFFFSNQPDLKSDFQPYLDFILRKIAHMSEFFVLSYLFFRAYRSSHFSVNESLVMVIIAVMIAACLDEYHQLFIAGRVGDFKDVIVDSLGVLAFCGLKLNESKRT